MIQDALLTYRSAFSNPNLSHRSVGLPDRRLNFRTAIRITFLQALTSRIFCCAYATVPSSAIIARPSPRDRWTSVKRRRTTPFAWQSSASARAASSRTSASQSAWIGMHQSVTPGDPQAWRSSSHNRRGWSEEQVQHLLTHSSPAMTEGIWKATKGRGPRSTRASSPFDRMAIGCHNEKGLHRMAQPFSIAAFGQDGRIRTDDPLPPGRCATGCATPRLMLRCARQCGGP